MNDSNLTPTEPLTTYDEAKLRHVKAAIDRIMTSIDPMLCACGGRKTFAWERECFRCVCLAIRARDQRREERIARETIREAAVGWTEACPRCRERLRPARCELCPDCGEYDREEALLEDESAECRRCGDVEPVSERGLCGGCERHARDIELRMEDPS